MTIRIPTHFVPRDYQLPGWRVFAEQDVIRNGVFVWPRRHGKDIMCLNILAKRALTMRVGNYYYYYKTGKQAKQAIWNGKDDSGIPFMSVFPGWPHTISQVGPERSMIESIDSRDHIVYLSNGSLFQLFGAGDEDTAVGANPVMCVFSEYSVQNPSFYDYMSPILLANDGVALFTYTARGHNHGYRLWNTNKDNPDWHVEYHTVETALHNGKRIITEAQLDKERRAGKSEEFLQQEYYNDWLASNVGAFYGREMRELQKSGRITHVPYDPQYEVHTAWDLGNSKNHASTAIWFFQVDYVGNVNVIDFYAKSGEGLLHYLKVVKEKPYIYGTHFGPHDISRTDFSSNASRLEIALKLGIRFFPLPMLKVTEGIEAARLVLPLCRFDQDKCTYGLEALRQYSRAETGLFDTHGVALFSEKEKKDWTNDPADAFRYLAIAVTGFINSTSYMDNNRGSVVHLQERAVVIDDLHGF